MLTESVDVNGRCWC